MDTKMVSQSVDDATKALKSSLSEGSTKLFGSMRDAKRGFLGGLSSTFDHVVNIVGGPEHEQAGDAAKVTSPSGNARVPGAETSDQYAAAVPGPAAERRRRGSGDSDADSEATEGCDERQDDFDEAAVSTNDKKASVEAREAEQSVQDMEDLSQLDPTTRDCIEFIKYIVNKIFDPSAEITPEDKAKFGEVCQQGMGRLWFSKYVSAQRGHNKQVAEQAILSLVQFFSVVLFECNEAEDYGPATTLMNMAFTFYHEVQDPKTQQDANIFTKIWSRTLGPKPKQYLYSYLTDQGIWQSPRFWNAAFFYAVQHERASKPTATSNTNKQEQTDDVLFQQNITFGQLRTFTSNMRSLGVPKDQCLEFIRRQSTIANLTRDQVKILREHMDQWKDESAVAK